MNNKLKRYVLEDKGVMDQKKILFSILGFFVFGMVLFMSSSCKKAVLTAPDNSTLVVTVNPAVIPLGGQAVVRVVGFKASGTPVPDGTVVFFSTDLGTIESRKEIIDGETQAIFTSNDNRSGTANLTITSGNSTVTPETITITVGTTGLGSLTISADPPVLPEGGGTSAIRVNALDENYNPLANIPITLTTDNGQLNSSGNTLITNSNGTVEDLLQTSETATITAYSGDKDATVTVNVIDSESPNASFVYSPTSPKVGENIHFNASASTDSDGTIVSYRWDFGDGSSGTGMTVTHRFRQTGTFSVVLVVEDNNGNQGTTSQTISVSDGNAPNASFVYSPNNPGVNETVYFNANGSTDEDGTIVSYDWDFGDGTMGAGQTVTHKYSESGTFTVVLQVIDDDDNTDTTSQSVSIGDNENPVASFSYSPTSPAVNEEIYFNASGSSDPDGTIVSYTWNFGDGSSANGMEVTHQFADSGTYTVYLQVTDDSGNTGSTSKSISVSENQAPTAAFVYSPTSAEVGERVHFNASDSYDPDGTIVSYEWDFGDNGHGYYKEVNHIYNETGTYTVVLVVTDDSGNSDSVSKTITVVDNSTPTASFTYSPGSPTTSDNITFNGSASSDPDGNIISYEWDFGDTDTIDGEDAIVTHQYSSAGIYTVWLTVTDNNQNSASTSRTVTVN